MSGLLRDMRHMDQGFAWHAAIIQTISSQALFVDEQDVRTQRSRYARGSKPPRPTADDGQIVEVVCHVCPSKGTRFLPTSSIALKEREFCSLDYIRSDLRSVGDETW